MYNPLNDKKAYFRGKARVVFCFLKILAETRPIQLSDIKTEVN